MTNLITRLAARTLELTPIVQPRLASVFASASGHSEAIDSTDSTVEATGIVAPTAAPPPLLVNPDRPTLPIAAHERSVTPALARSTAAAPALPEPNQPAPQLRSAVASDRPVLDVDAVAGDRIVPAVDRKQDDRAEPPVLSERELPGSNQIASTRQPLPPPNPPQSAATTDWAERGSPPSLSDEVTPKDAINPSPFEMSRSPDQLALPQSSGQPPPTAALAKSFSLERGTSDPVGVQGKADPAVVPLAPSEKELGLRRERSAERAEGKRLTTPTPQQPLIHPIDRADEPFPDILPVVVPRQTTLLPIVTPRLERPASLIPKGSHRPEEKAAPPPPTIQVTIGRIEVRAVSAPAPPRPRTVAPPARLSLENYLRSRSGGER